MTNEVVEGYIGSDGHVVFNHLSPIEYYVDVSESHHNNYKLAGEDIGFIRTGILYRNEFNQFTTYVDYFSNLKMGRIQTGSQSSLTEKRVAKNVGLTIKER